MVHGSVHCFVHGFVHDFVHGLVHGFVYGIWFMVHGVHHNVLLEHGGLPCFFPSDVHLDTSDTLWYFYLNHVIQLRPFKTALDDVLQEQMVDYRLLFPSLSNPSPLESDWAFELGLTGAWGWA